MQTSEAIASTSDIQIDETLPEAENLNPVEIANQAYQHLSDLFKRHIDAFMLDAGQYIIKTFYDEDARKALIKNKSSNGSPSLKLLIEKLKESKNDPTGNAPSVSWFYKAVNLAAHEAICQELGLSTFTILGHSHKLQLLNVPKLKQIQGDKIEEALKPAFEEKDRLAKTAVEKNLSVRDFVKHIKDAFPPKNSKITANQIPGVAELQKLPPKKLEGLREQIESHIANLQQKLKRYQEDKSRLEKAIKKISDQNAQ